MITFTPIARTLLSLALSVLPLATSAQQPVCSPPTEPLPVLKPQRTGGLQTVDGAMVPFDYCHKSVSFEVPSLLEKPPLMVLVHGGAGKDGATIFAAESFRSKGMATLVFDAFQMNGFNQGAQFFASKVSNEARQRMLYATALGAYEWALRQDKIDNRRILFHGLSNGGTVVANLAAVVDPKYVIALIAEGAPSLGLGLPDELKAPLKMVFGKLDNYAGRSIDEYIWLRQESCAGNVVRFNHPKGNSITCNPLNPYSSVNPKPIDWYQAQKAKGADIDLWWVEDTAHGVFSGPINKRMITYGESDHRFAWVGGTPAARTKFLNDVAALTKR